MYETKNRDQIVAELEGAGSKFTGDSCTCPFHRDRHPSAGIYQTNAGAWRFRCHVCDINHNVIDIAAKLSGKTVDEIMERDSSAHKKTKKYTESEVRAFFLEWEYLHEYRDKSGTITHFVAFEELGWTRPNLSTPPSQYSPHPNFLS